MFVITEMDPQALTENKTVEILDFITVPRINEELAPSDSLTLYVKVTNKVFTDASMFTLCMTV